MRFARSCRLPLLFVILGAGWGSPREESPSELALKEKGLTKAGTAFTIEDEKPVLVKMKEARTAYAAYAAMSSQHAAQQELATRATQLQEQATELKTQLDELNQRIGENSMGQGNPGPPGGGGGMGGGGPGGMNNRSFVSPLTIERDQVKAALAQVTAEQKTVKNQSPQAKDTTSLESRVKRADEVFKEILGDLRKQVDSVLKKYGELDADATVKKALGEVKKVNPKLHLGPSDAFNTGIKELVKAEQQFLGKRTTTVSNSKKRSRSKK